MSRNNLGAKIVQKARRRAYGGVNGYIHVAKPATASEILYDLGISQAQAKRLLQGLKFARAGS